jgi:hypothetical protein
VGTVAQHEAAQYRLAAGYSAGHGDHSPIGHASCVVQREFGTATRPVVATFNV